ncbi:MAG: hypothetical protein PWP65_1793 [Clostridia bacterium]|nr:hypothetical protein [Clostridia bacterium]
MKANMKIRVVLERGIPENWHNIYRLVEEKGRTPTNQSGQEANTKTMDDADNV